MLNRVLTTAIVSAALFSATATVNAAEVAGLQIDDRSRVGNSELILNGAGLRTKVFFKIYIAALYTPKKLSTAKAVLELPETRRMVLHMMRDVDADTLIGALKEGLQENHSPTELAQIKTETEQFEAVMRGIGNARKNDIVAIDFSGEGTRIGFNGQPRGSVTGEAFGRALLKVWLGDKPVDVNLKQALLGG